MFLHLFEFFLKFSVLFGVDYPLCIDLCKSLSLDVVVDLLENLFMIVLFAGAFRDELVSSGCFGRVDFGEECRIFSFEGAEVWRSDILPFPFLH